MPSSDHPAPTPSPGLYCIVLTTLASQAQAEAMARDIVQARLGACVQVHAIKSFYKWKDGLCIEPEWQLSIKTRQAQFTLLTEFIEARHAYAVPEIVQIPITAGSAAYLRWLDDESPA